MERAVVKATRNTAKWLARSGWHRKIHQAGDQAQSSANRALELVIDRWGDEITGEAVRLWDARMRGRRSSVNKVAAYISPEVESRFHTLEEVLGIKEVAKRMWRHIPVKSYVLAKGVAPEELYSPQGGALSLVIGGNLGDLWDAMSAFEDVPGP
jgi:hypothetical protein